MGKLNGEKKKSNFSSSRKLRAGSSSNKKGAQDSHGRAAQAAVSALTKKYPSIDRSQAQAMLRCGFSPNSILGTIIKDAGYRPITPAPVEVNLEQTASKKKSSPVKIPSPIKTPAPAKVKTVVDSEGLPVDVEAVIKELIRCGHLKSEDVAQPAGHKTAGDSGTAEDEEEEGEERGARKVGAALWHQVMSRDRYTCQFCFYEFPELEDQNEDNDMQQQGPARRLTVDHDVPWCAGGPTIFENLFCACEPCNHCKDMFWWDDLVPLNRDPPTTTFPFTRPTVPKHHWLTMNRRVRRAVKKLKHRGLFSKVAGGEHPDNFKAVRAAMENVDPVVSNSPLKDMSKKRKIVYESEGEEWECEEVQPLYKSRRTR